MGSLIAEESGIFGVSMASPSDLVSQNSNAVNLSESLHVISKSTTGDRFGQESDRDKKVSANNLREDNEREVF
jgi:hypothetical protein